MQIDNAGNIWVGTLDGLFKINPGTAKIIARIPFVSGQIVQALTIDPSGKIWAGTPRNVIEINPNTNKAIARINPVTGRDIVALGSSSTGRLWIGMRDGLVVADTYNGKITSSISNLPSSSVINLLVSDRQVWIGTEGGLGKINTNLKKSEIPNANATVVYKIR